MITERQRELRKKSIGSSDAAALLGLDKYRTPYDLWLEKTGRIEGFSGNAATERGEYLEDGLLRWAESKLGKIVKPSNSFTLVTEAGTVLRAHVDGQRDKYAKGNTVIEAKNMVHNDDEWGPDNSDEIPFNVYIQVQHQMLCAEAPDAWVIRLGKYGFTKHPIDADPDIQSHIIRQADAFWQTYVVADEPPPFDKVSDTMTQYMQQSYQTDGTETVLDDEHMKMFKYWDEVEKEAAERKAYHKARVLGQMGDAKKGKGEMYRCSMVRGGGGKRLDADMVKQMAPELYEKCLVESATYHYPRITQINTKGKK